MKEMEAGAIVEFQSSASFDITLERVLTAIAQAGLTVFSQIDHRTNAQDVGLDMPPTTVITYGNPKGGTPVMLAAPLAALDLPLRVLVRTQNDGQTSVAFRPIGKLLHASGVPDALAKRLEPAQQILVDAVLQ